MTGNSLQDLLLRLKDGEVMFGWGAIMAFSRDQVNRFLARQHIEGLEGLRFLLPYTETFYVNDDRTEEVELRGIMVGPPILSFENASLNKSALTLTMNITGGSFSSRRHSASAPASLLTAFSITQDMGFHVRMTANLNQAFGEVDKTGRVTLDLSIGEKVTCNLGSVEKIRERIGQYFQRYFAGQPEQQRRFTIGRVALNAYNPLSPTAFAVRTQPAPGTRDARAAGEGDGAIVVFIRIKAQEGEPLAGLPVEGSNFPYLIPDDVSAGRPRYSASLLIARPYLHLVDENQLQVLSNMMFPGDNAFVESQGDRYEPFDRVAFGNVALKPGAVVIEPSSVQLGAGKTQQFVARRGDGTAIASVQWSVSSPDYPMLTGTITTSGVYTATPTARMRRDRLPLVVTATYQEGGVIRRASALVHERFETLNVAPLIQVKSGNDAAPVTVHATTLGTGPVRFRILEPTLGARLEPVDAHHQSYFPPPQVQDEPLIVQSIETWEEGSTERALAAVLLVNKPMYLQTDPYYVAGMAPGETVQLRLTNDDIDPGLLVWRVLGEGTVEDGLFTAPAPGTSPISVVVCELPPSSPIYPSMYGYSIINLQPVQQQYVPIRWEDLHEFSIEAPNGPTRCFANGLQQVPLVIKIETMPVDVGGQLVEIPLSDVELSRLRLVDQISGQAVPFVDSYQEGIPHGSDMQWAVGLQPNRFRLYSPGEAGAAVRRAVPQPSSNATRYREMFVHMAVDGPRTFYAEFQAENGSWWRSSEDIGGEGSVTVTGVRPPSVNPTPGPNESYDLVRERVHNGEGDGGETGDEPFHFFLSSVDYWRLRYKKMGLHPVVFATLEIEGNVSTIQWESEVLEERFFSYTGFAFYPMTHRGEDHEPAGLTFDIYYRAMVNSLSGTPVDEQFHSGAGPATGELIFSLHRVADMPYWHDGMAGEDPQRKYRALLDKPVLFVLLDEEGNRHRLQVSFPSPAIQDSRNSLRLHVQ